MNKQILKLKLLLILSFAITPFANAKVESQKLESNKTVFTYYGTATGFGEHPSEASTDAHDQVWNTIYSILMNTGYILIDLRIIKEGPFDSNTETYPVTYEADFWDGGSFKKSPLPLLPPF